MKNPDVIWPIKKKQIVRVNLAKKLLDNICHTWFNKIFNLSRITDNIQVKGSCLKELQLLVLKKHLLDLNRFLMRLIVN